VKADAKTRFFARRAVWAAIQHPEIGVGMVELETLVEKSITIAEDARTTEQAVNKAQKAFGVLG